jgi:hypothetical protein
MTRIWDPDVKYSTLIREICTGTGSCTFTGTALDASTYGTVRYVGLLNGMIL